MPIKQLPIVYIAGAYSADNVLDVLRNIREGVKLGRRVLASGVAAPFVPFLDWQFEMFGDHNIEIYYQYALAFLPHSDAVLCRREGAEASKGTQAELALADELRIPVFYDDEFDALIEAIKDANTR